MTNGAPVRKIVQILAKGDASAVAVVDFAEFTSRGTLAELICRDLPGHTVLRIDAVTAYDADDLAVDQLSLDELARACARELRQDAPSLVVGYCSASSLAVRIAAELAGPGAAPAVVLVEPTWLTPVHIRGELKSVRASLHASDEYTGPIDAASLSALLRADATRELTRQGLPDEEVEMCAELLVARYDTWFGFLLMTLRDTEIPVGRQYDGPVTLLRGQADDPAVEHHDAENFPVLWLPIASADVLRSEATSSAILATIAGASA
jgi:hypothetical protein